jgi:iron complex transport system ATP-binding protein
LILERLRARAEAGAAVVVTSHDLAIAARFCDRLAVLHHGRLRIVGAPDDALSREILAEVFALDGELIASPAGLILAARRLPGWGAGRAAEADLLPLREKVAAKRSDEGSTDGAG